MDTRGIDRKKKCGQNEEATMKKVKMENTEWRINSRCSHQAGLDSQACFDKEHSAER